MSVSLFLLEITSPKAVFGDATIDGFIGQITVETFAWGVHAKTVEKPNSEPRTTVEPKTLSLTKHFDRSSVVLCQMMEGDEPFKATLRFIDPTTKTKGQNKFDSVLEIELVGCHIENIALSADDSGKSVSVTERLTISFEESVTFHYRSYDSSTRSRPKAMTTRVETPANVDKR